ncbi:MAG: hypothetical protein WC658_02585 [Candidatus Omnitrophota bacterium]
MAKEYNLILSLGKVPVQLASQSHSIIEMLRQALKGFITTGVSPTIKIDIILDKDIENINPYTFGNPHKTGVLKEEGNFFVRGSTYRGWFYPKSLEGSIIQGPAVAPTYLYLRFIVSIYLPLVDGFLIHSTSVARDGASYLFSGPPQSGKSTVARLSANYRILSDDFSIVRKIGAQFCCFGSPFWGHVEPGGENLKQGLPIRGLYLLKQDNEVYLRRLGKGEGTLRLLQNISVISRDAETNKRIVGLADEFTGRVKVNSLHFKPDNSFWRAIENDGDVC